MTQCCPAYNRVESEIGEMLFLSGRGKLSGPCDLKRGSGYRSRKDFSSNLSYLALKWAMTEKFWENLLGQKCVGWTDPLSHPNTTKQQHISGGPPSWLPLTSRSSTAHSANANADSISRQHQITNTLSGLDTALPGTTLPESVRCQKIKIALRVMKMLPFAFPSNSSNHLLTLQQADLVLGEFLHF